MEIMFGLLLFFGLLFIFGFGFFSYILFLEMFMIYVIMINFFYNKMFSSMKAIILLVLGACEIALGLSLLVNSMRFGKMDRMNMKKCGGF